MKQILLGSNPPNKQNEIFEFLAIYFLESINYYLDTKVKKTSFKSLRRKAKTILVYLPASLFKNIKNFYSLLWQLQNASIPYSIQRRFLLEA